MSLCCPPKHFCIYHLKNMTIYCVYIILRDYLVSRDIKRLMRDWAKYAENSGKLRDLLEVTFMV